MRGIQSAPALGARVSSRALFTMPPLTRISRARTPTRRESTQTPVAAEGVPVSHPPGHQARLSLEEPPWLSAITESREQRRPNCFANNTLCLERPQGGPLRWLRQTLDGLAHRG